MSRGVYGVVFGGLTSLALLGCSDEEPSRAVVFHVPATCGRDLGRAFLDVYGLGDFEPTPAAPGTARFFASDLVVLGGLPTNSRLLKTAASIPESPFALYGASPVPSSGDVHMLLLPSETSCRLSGFLTERVGSSVGAAGESLVLSVGGSAKDGQSVPRSFAIDLARGRVSELAIGLATPRSRATVTPFGTGAIVAGGVNLDTGTPLATAEVYVPAASAADVANGAPGDFTGTPMALAIPRSDHAAVRLRSGETLLVGGATTSGLSQTMESLDPKTARTRTSGVARLAFPRRLPSAMLLANGEVFVAGGTDETGNPVTALEWFRADARAPSRRPRFLVAAKTRAFVPLFGGGALAVLSKDDGTRMGNIWRVTADGDIELAGEVTGLPDAFTLVSSASDAPLLYAEGAWRKFDPWASRFVESTLAREGPSEGARILPTSEPSGAMGGLVTWVETDGFVRGFRATTVSAFDRVPRPLLRFGLEGFVLDRTPSKERVSFTPDRGLGLASAVTAMIADYTFKDFALGFELHGESGEVAPLLVLRLASGEELEVGESLCPLGPVGRQRRLEIQRKGNVLSGFPAGACTLPIAEDERVALGFRGSPRQASFSAGIRDVTLTR